MHCVSSELYKEWKWKRDVIFAIGYDIFLESGSDSSKCFFCFQHFYWCLHTSSSYILAYGKAKDYLWMLFCCPARNNIKIKNVLCCIVIQKILNSKCELKKLSIDFTFYYFTHFALKGINYKSNYSSLLYDKCN